MLNTNLLNNKNVKSRLLSGKKIFLFIAGISLLTVAGCGDKKTDDNSNAGVPPGMVAADLSAKGLAVLVNVPDSTNGPLEILENAQGGADVKVGKNFQMTITEGAGDMAMKKSDITSDAVRKFVRYVTEDANAIVWEWQIQDMEPEFHFYAIVKAGDKSFEVRDVEGEIFSEKAATQMLDAARSIRLKAPVKAES
jgi:hypothetical protein